MQTPVSQSEQIFQSVDQVTICKTENMVIEELQSKTKVSNEKFSNKEKEQNSKDFEKESNVHVDSTTPLTNNVYSINYLIDQLDKTKTSLLDLNFEAFLRTALKFYPIISSIQNLTNTNNSEQSKTRYFKPLPFSAQSIHEFYSWPYGKRKAMEWMRALHVKRKCEEIIKLIQNSSDKKTVESWSTKSVLLWLRSHGYTPLEYQHMILPSEREKDLDKYGKSVLTTSYVNSLTPFNTILGDQDYLKVFNDKTKWKEQMDNDDNLILDVENNDDQAQILKLKLKSKKSSQNIASSFGEKMSNYIEMCEESQYVKEQLDLVSKFLKLNLNFIFTIKNVIFKIFS